MFDTRNDLPANVRTKLIELLNARLADAIDLGTQTKHAHWNAHVDALSSALAAFGAKVRAGIDEAARIGDADTADLFTGISRETDKDLWFLEAHLHAKR
jgi:DNA-binding ferritin-like protein